MSTLVSSKGNLMDSVSLLQLLIDFSEVWPSTSTVPADEAHLTRSPLERLTEKRDFLGIYEWESKSGSGI